MASVPIPNGQGDGFFRALVENSLDIIHLVDADGIIRYMTPSVEKVLGYTPDELIGRVGHGFIHPDDLTGAMEGFETALRHEGPSQPMEFRLRHKDGSWRDFEIRATNPAPNAEEPVVIVYSRDVTRRRRMEADLKLSQLYLEQLFQSAPEGIVLLDNEDRVLRANTEFIRIFGYTLDEMRNRPINDLIIPDHLTAEAVEITHNVTHGTPVSAETVRRRKDGSLIHVSMLGSPIRMKNGQIGIYGIYRDISDRVRMERQHIEVLEREREARAEAEVAERQAAFLAGVGTIIDGTLDYHTTLNNLARLTVPDLADYCLIDEVEEGGDVIRRVAVAHANPERERMLYREVRQSLDENHERHPVVGVIRTGTPMLVTNASDDILDAIAHDAEHRAGLQQLQLQSFIIVPLIARGRTLGAITLAAAESGRQYGPRDLALAEEVARRAALAVDNARLYGRAQQAVQARERVLAFVSHDLRNPLATILLNVSSILETLPEEAPTEWLREQLGWIERSTEQMNRLIEDLLDVARIEAGSFAIECRPVPVTTLIEDALRMFGPLANEKSLRLQAEPVGGECIVCADRDRLVQVFSNLIGNAIKFTPGGGTVSLAAESRDEVVQFRVSDNGCGVAPEHLPYLFERFWQVRRSLRGGAGLGLAITRGIVEAHDGQIWVESAEGVGTSVYFTLPSVQAEAESHECEGQATGA